MSKHACLLRLLLLLFPAWLLFAAPSPDDPSQSLHRIPAADLAQGFSSRCILAMPKPGMDPTSTSPEEAVLGLRLLEVAPYLGNLRLLELPQNADPQALSARLRASGAYQSASVDRILSEVAIPNDTYFAQQWGLRNTGSGGGKSGADISASSGWDIRSDASSILVGVLDSGARVDHPDLSANLWVNPGEIPGNGIDDDGDGYVDDINGATRLGTSGSFKSGDVTDESGHGTHVAGIIGAVGNNNLGVIGVAPKVSIMPLKFLGADGKGYGSSAMMLLNFAIGRGVRLFNASFGAEGDSAYQETERYALNSARAYGVLFVCAAGNSSANIDVSKSYPASYQVDNIITVGNSTNLDDVSPSSNYGSGSCDLFAPGEAILSLNYTSITGSSAYRLLSGTSMAAPHVTGALALRLAGSPTAPADYRNTINALLRSVDKVAAFNGRCQTGGRLNLAKLLACTDLRPFNDDFADRAKILGEMATVRSGTSGATLEPAEPLPTSSSITGSLWWEWTAPSSARVTVDTNNSQTDLVAAVYTGSSLGSLTLVPGLLPQAKVIFNAIGGQTYQICVGSRFAGAYLVSFSLATVPDHDAFASAKLLSGPSVSTSDINSVASKESADPLILSTDGSRSLWYKWVAPSSATMTVAMSSGDFVPACAAYTGTNLATLQLVSEAVGTDTDKRASFSFTPLTGQTYYFQSNTTSSSTTGSYKFLLTDALWVYATGSSNTNSLAVASDGTAYTADSNNLFYALSPTGVKLWSYTKTGGADSSHVSIDGAGNLFSPFRTGFLTSITPAGLVRWEKTLGTSCFNGPAIAADGTVYIKDDTGLVLALENATGTSKWTYATSSQATYGTPSIALDGTIYVGDGGPSDASAVRGTLHAINPTTGSAKWTFTADQAIYTTPSIDSSGNLYFCTTGGSIYSLNSAGAQRWKRSFSKAITSSPAISATGATLYFAGYDGLLHALSSSTGSDVWSYNLGNEVRASSPAIDSSGIVYVGTYGNRVVAVNPDGSLNRIYATTDWVRSSPVIAGTRLLFGSNDGSIYAYQLGRAPATSGWPMKACNASRNSRKDPDSAPVITAQPGADTRYLGARVTLSVSAEGTGLAYQWFKDNQSIDGATSSTYVIPKMGVSDNGSYTVHISNAFGITPSNALVLTGITGVTGRIVNLSVRALSAPGQPLIIGFVCTEGSTPKPLLLRGMGPSLIPAPWNLVGALTDPSMELYDSQPKVIDTNNDWGGAQAISLAATSTGAFAFLSPVSKDSALLKNLSGLHTVHIISANGQTGTALAEVYDTDLTPGPLPASGSLKNISALANVGTGDDILIAGFVLTGDLPRTVLIRGMGPSLSSFDVPGYLLDPKLELYSGSLKIHENNNWGGASSIGDTAKRVGAFDFVLKESTDAALLLTLEPGSYTAHLSGVNNTTGRALVEVYAVPD